MIYFDQAATSFPKPKVVTKAMIDCLEQYSANPGRGGHYLAQQASDIIQKTRERAAALFGLNNPKRALFYPNATVAINQAIKGIAWQSGDHIIATSLEHNAIYRPLEYIKQTYGVSISYIPYHNDADSFISDVKQAIRPETKFFAVTHASNVTGSVIPLEDICPFIKQTGIRTLVDASQTVGHIKINMEQLGIDMLAFPGHKGLLGPQGTGMLLVRDGINLLPIHHGGTGRFSNQSSQPDEWPEHLESGTLNTPGIAGLHAALQLFEQRKEENVPRETILANQLYQRLSDIAGVHCYGMLNQTRRMPIVAFNIGEISSQEIAAVLDSHYHIAVRAGLHCSPLAHRTLGTTEQGVIRASLGQANTEAEVDQFVQAVTEIVEVYQEL